MDARARNAESDFGEARRGIGVNYRLSQRAVAAVVGVGSADGTDRDVRI